MVWRIWHGRTRADRSDSYRDFLLRRAIPDYRQIPGNLGAWVLRRLDGDTAHFLTVSVWDSEDSIRAFAGKDLLKAKYYPEDLAFLLELEPTVKHYEVCSDASPAQPPSHESS